MLRILALVLCLLPGSAWASPLSVDIYFRTVEGRYSQNGELVFTLGISRTTGSFVFETNTGEITFFEASFAPTKFIGGWPNSDIWPASLGQFDENTGIFSSPMLFKPGSWSEGAEVYLTALTPRTGLFHFSGFDTGRNDKLRINGTYQLVGLVPIPPSFVLFGTALGMAFTAMRFRSRRSLRPSPA